MEMIKLNFLPYMQLNFSGALSYVHFYNWENTAKFLLIFLLLHCCLNYIFFFKVYILAMKTDFSF